MPIKFKCCIVIVCMVIVGCNHYRQSAAPVVQYAVKLSDIPEVYIVSDGDSLYSIAWKYDLDFKTIAVNNHLQTPEHIYPGQKLHLLGQSSHRPGYVRGKRPPKIRKTNKNSPAVVTITGKNISQQSTGLKKTDKLIQPAIHQKDLLAKTWVRPAVGRIIKAYSSKEDDFNKGIDFAGHMNDKILAAQAGKVVYSGAGLRGYGKLIIIKHNETYLSAYAHNNQLLVTEGDVVIIGQQIAKMGNTDSNRIKLHFQIRKNGQPVDPSRYL